MLIDDHLLIRTKSIPVIHANRYTKPLYSIYYNDSKTSFRAFGCAFEGYSPHTHNSFQGAFYEAIALLEENISRIIESGFGTIHSIQILDNSRKQIDFHLNLQDKLKLAASQGIELFIDHDKQYFLRIEEVYYPISEIDGRSFLKQARTQYEVLIKPPKVTSEVTIENDDWGQLASYISMGEYIKIN